MNKIISILICCFIAGCLFVSCEQPDIPDVPNYDKTEILTFKVYNQDKEEVGTPVILSDEGVVTITDFVLERWSGQSRHEVPVSGITGHSRYECPSW